MFWDKKKDNKLPDLPPSSQFVPLNRPQFNDYEEPDKIHELPSFPDSPMQRGFSQAAIKQAISQDEEDPEESSLPELPRSTNHVEMEDFQQWQPRPSIEMKSKENKPVFVRVDKFQVAKSSLENIKLKLADIENILKQIHQVKMKEDQEIASWEADLGDIKTRIQHILSDIFDKQEY